MTDNSIPDDLKQVHEVRRIIREAGGLMTTRNGLLPVDVALGTFFAAMDIAEGFAGYGMGAVEWLRNACDVAEQMAMSDAPRLAE